MMDKVFYKYLSTNDQNLVDKIDNHEILGASQQIDIISQIMINVVEENEDLDVDTLLELIDNIKRYYLNSRGNASRAFVNNIKVITKGLRESTTDYKALKEKLSKNIKEYKDGSEQALSKILEYSFNELSVYDDIFLFDYSSTIERVITNLSEKNSKTFNLYISESSAIDGGRPYLQLAEKKNINIKFFPDAAAYYYLKKSQCCLMGAETFYSNGMGFNTIGSDLVGCLSSVCNTKLYFITMMNKLDERRNLGIRKERVSLQYSEKYKNSDKLPTNIDTDIPELIGVPPENIYAYITEYGVVPAGNIYLVSRNYLESIGG